MKQRLLLLFLSVTFLLGSVSAQKIELYNFSDPIYDDFFTDFSLPNNTSFTLGNLTIAGKMLLPSASQVYDEVYNRGFYGDGDSGVNSGVIPTRRYVTFPVTGACEINVYGYLRSTGGTLDCLLSNDNGVILLGSVTEESANIARKCTFSYEGTEPGNIYLYQPNNPTTKNFVFCAIEIISQEGEEEYDASISSLKVNNNNIQIETEMLYILPYDYSESTISVEFKVSPQAEVKINSSSVSNNNGTVSYEVSPPDLSAGATVFLDIEVILGEENKQYSLIIERDEPIIENVIFHETFSNFTTSLTEFAFEYGTLDEYGYVVGGGDKGLACLEDGTLAMTGARFITRYLNLTGTEVKLYVTYKTITPGLNKSFQIALNVNAASGGVGNILNEKANLSPVDEFETREFTLSNTTPYSFIQFRTESEHTVIISEIKIVAVGRQTKGAGVIGNNTVAVELTENAISGLGEVNLAGDITSKYIDILNNASLTSINIEAASSFAEGFTPVNSNCLVFASSTTTIFEEEPSYNLIINGEADQITLTDGSSFHNPKTFTAGTILYTRDFIKGWASMCLPFNIALTDLEGVEFVQAFTGVENETTVLFNNVTDVVANTPYIAYIPQAGETTFETSGTVPATKMIDVKHGDYTFKGNYSQISGHNHYGLNSHGTGFSVGGKTSSIAAFRAYIEGVSVDGESMSLVIGKNDGDGTTGIDNTIVNGLLINSLEGGLQITTDQSQEISIYSLDGRLVNRTIINEGQTTINGLQKGIYLLNNQKVVVR